MLGVLRIITFSETSQAGKRRFQLPASTFPAIAARRCAISFLVLLQGSGLVFVVLVVVAILVGEKKEGLLLLATCTTRTTTATLKARLAALQVLVLVLVLVN